MPRVSAFPRVVHLPNDAAKDTEYHEDGRQDSDTENDYVVHVVLRAPEKYRPNANIDGTHRPTKIPVSRLPGPSSPNQSDTENKKDKKAAAKIK